MAASGGTTRILGCGGDARHNFQRSPGHPVGAGAQELQGGPVQGLLNHRHHCGSVLRAELQLDEEDTGGGQELAHNRLHRLVRPRKVGDSSGMLHTICVRDRSLESDFEMGALVGDPEHRGANVRAQAAICVAAARAVKSGVTR